MAQADKTKNGSKELPDGWQDWISIGECTRRLNVAHSFITKKELEGAIGTCIEPRTGRRLYNPADIESLRSYVATADEAELHPSTAKESVTAEGFKAGTDLIKQVYQHHERLLPLAFDGYSKLFAAYEARIDSMAKELAAKDARIAEMVKEREELAKSREALISEEHERVMVMQRIESSEKRKDRALEVVSKNFMPLILQKFGMADPRVKVGLELLSSLTKEQLLPLLAIPGIISKEQRVLLLKLLEGQLTPEEQAAIAELEKPEASSEEKTS